MLPWGGITCCLSAAVLYLLGRRSGRHAEALNSTTRVNKLVDLAQLLDAASKLLPLVVAVTGRVGSDSPINCKCSGLRGVIVEETEEEHLLKHSDAGSWIEDSALVSYRRQEASWYLDDGTDRVYVVGARGAKGLVLTTGSEVFEESGKSGHSLMLGVKRIERVLPTGTSLTVVGEAIRDDTGTIRIQQPHRGPIYVSHTTIDELIANLGKWARCYKYSSVGFTVFGVYLLSKHVFQHIIARRRHWEVRKRIHKAAATRRQDNEGSDGKTGNASDSTKKDRSIPDLCVICLEQEYNSVFVPCGHMCCCTVCSSHLTNCPLCRRRIEQVVKTFRH